MTTIVFEDEGVEVEAQVGQLIIDVAEPAGCLSFGCAAGHCAVCAITISEGAGALEAPHDVERYTLTPDEIDEGVRLACKVRLAHECTRVVMRSYW